jgi:CHAD domain-containing protein
VRVATRRCRTTTRTIFGTDESRFGTSRVPARELAERAGHARPSMSLDVYSHVMRPDEVPAERFLSLLTDEGR